MFCNTNLSLSLHCSQDYCIFPPTPLIMRLNQLVSADSSHMESHSEQKVTETNKPSKTTAFCLSGDSDIKVIFRFPNFLQHRALFNTIFTCVFEVSKVCLMFFISSQPLKVHVCLCKKQNSVKFKFQYF